MISKSTTSHPRSKKTVLVWLDPDVISLFPRGGRGWQTRINAALRKAAKLPKERKKA